MVVTDCDRPSQRPMTGRPTVPMTDHPTDRPTEPRWLPITEAAAELGLSREALRGKVKRRTIRSKKGNDGRIAVLVSDRPTDRPSVPPPPQGRPWDGPGTTQGATVPCEPMVPLSLHREALDRADRAIESERARHHAEVARLEAAYRAASDSLMGKVAALLLAERRRPWWRRWL